MLGIVSRDEALAKAAEANLDLVNISPNAAPPVCKIMDFGKYRYEQQKRDKEAKKNQKTVDVKEIRLGIFTDIGDLKTKVITATKFLEAGDKVKVNMRFRGREMGYIDKGKAAMLHFVDMLSEHGTLEKNPQLEGRNMSLTINPKTEKEKEKAAKALQAQEGK